MMEGEKKFTFKGTDWIYHVVKWKAIAFKRVFFYQVELKFLTYTQNELQI